jgi:hypothetical protein
MGLTQAAGRASERSTRARRQRRALTGDHARDVGADDGLAEDRAVEDVANGAVGRLPHLLEAELCAPRRVRRNTASGAKATAIAQRRAVRRDALRRDGGVPFTRSSSGVMVAHCAHVRCQVRYGEAPLVHYTVAP